MKSGHPYMGSLLRAHNRPHYTGFYMANSRSVAEVEGVTGQIYQPEVKPRADILPVTPETMAKVSETIFYNKKQFQLIIEDYWSYNHCTHTWLVLYKCVYVFFMY